MPVSVFNVDLKERVCHLTNKIYREMLFIKGRGRTTYITMNGLDNVQVGALSLTPQYRIVLPWDLLAWMSVEGEIFSSFYNFITTPELSGLLYISPDIYHTQITECMLEKIYQWVFLSVSNIFLNFFLLDVPFAFSMLTGPLGNTFPMLFQLN